VGAYVNIGFQAENIVKGESPFTKPEPIFRSPRNLRQMASQKVKRNWRKPSSVIANAKCEGLPDDSQFDAGYDKACFYAGYDPAGTKCQSEGFKIISDTPGGISFNVYMVPYYAQQKAGILQYDRDVSPMDSCASAAYARSANGSTLRVYIRCDKWASKSGGFFDTELPILLENQNVDHLDAYVETCANCSTRTGCAWPTVATFSYK
jgi:hypothetical protein